MDRNAIMERVKQVVAKVLKISADEIRPESNFVFDLGAVSQQSIELVAAFEEEFDIEMDEDSALEVQTVQGAVDYIAQLMP
ncbi:MAG: acyl carrier protein [bacterium]